MIQEARTAYDVMRAAGITADEICRLWVRRNRRRERAWQRTQLRATVTACLAQHLAARIRLTQRAAFTRWRVALARQERGRARLLAAIAGEA